MATVKTVTFSLEMTIPHPKVNYANFKPSASATVDVGFEGDQKAMEIARASVASTLARWIMGMSHELGVRADLMGMPDIPSHIMAETTVVPSTFPQNIAKHPDKPFERDVDDDVPF